MIRVLVSPDTAFFLSLIYQSRTKLAPSASAKCLAKRGVMATLISCLDRGAITAIQADLTYLLHPKDRLETP